ncbi:PREDICTED: serine/threonine-protein phosphatase 6 regulatory ankyrin repeat subunit B-like [Acropora digitifera]|uniref:serine/threonine-protein phosphatase 6 regulatory ankyrin repeat subunit B-like n=1 Tax=Acropora digitifera TaxID=70779 RepID=UPI00077AAAD6|nr:PREDICTED: serine/threonine-protein phosphatase 6 regulatory ankyrin repeat subunit B-like [Acropora digitifera]
MDTREIAKVQRLEEQLHRVTPEAFYEPGSVLKLEVNEEEKVLETSEDEQHLRDFGETSSAQTTAADEWLEQRPLAIPVEVGQLHPTTLGQHIEEGSMSSGSKNIGKLGKRRYSESSAGHGKCTLLYLICRFCLSNSLLVQASRRALHKASVNGQYEEAQEYLSGGCAVDVKDQFSLTPLHLACWYGQEAIVKLLLEHGADVNATDRVNVKNTS